MFKILLLAAVAVFSMTGLANAQVIEPGAYLINDYTLSGSPLTFPITIPGELGADTQLSITLTDTNVNTATSSATADLSTSFTSAPTAATTPVMLTSNISGTTWTESYVIKNLTSAPEYFYYTMTELINLVVTQGCQCGTATLTIAAVVAPLPPAFLFFASGLIALAGFSMYRKAHSQI